MCMLKNGYLDGPHGALHLTMFLPATGKPPSSWVVHLPAFAEEMNKSRAMVARQARAFAAAGVAVVVPDLLGTGDSAARLEEVSWQGWADDIVHVCKWVQGQGGEHLVLWGHRLGCLLALDVAQVLGQQLDHLLLWQPVHSGKQHMTQFMRLRMAAGLASGGSETVSILQERLEREQSLEIAGYTLGAELYQNISQKALSGVYPPLHAGVTILEVTRESGKPALVITEKLVKQWAREGVSCQAQAVVGDPFWMTQELGFAPRLIEQTLALVLERLGVIERTESLHSAACLSKEGVRLAVDSGEGERGVVFPCREFQLAGVIHDASAEAC